MKFWHPIRCAHYAQAQADIFLMFSLAGGNLKRRFFLPVFPSICTTHSKKRATCRHVMTTVRSWQSKHHCAVAATVTIGYLHTTTGSAFHTLQWQFKWPRGVGGGGPGGTLLYTYICTTCTCPSSFLAAIKCSGCIITFCPHRVVKQLNFPPFPPASMHCLGTSIVPNCTVQAPPYVNDFKCPCKTISYNFPIETDIQYVQNSFNLYNSTVSYSLNLSINTYALIFYVYI